MNLSLTINYFLSLLFIVLLFLVLTIIFEFSIVRKEKEIEDSSYSRYVDYKYLVVDSLSRKTKRGVFSFQEDLFPNGEEETMIRGEPIVGIQVLISTFGGEEYVCTGSCYCTSEQEIDSRRTFSVLPSRKGLLFLVSAVSSIIAIQKAGLYFKEECTVGLENECSGDQVIFSEVDNCDTINDYYDRSSDSIDSEFTYDDDDDDDDDDDEPETTDFRCIGRCKKDTLKEEIMDETEKEVEVNILKDEILYDERLSKEERTNLILDYLLIIGAGNVNIEKYCNSLELTATVSVERNKEVRDSISFQIQEERAMDLFTTVHLHKYCKSNSLFTTEEYKEKFYYHRLYTDERLQKLFDKTREVYSTKISETIPLCRAKRGYLWVGPVGIDDDETRIIQMNNIVCLRIFTDDEWEKGIPYENENLRHWKEGYKIDPDRLTHNQIVRYHSSGVNEAFSRVLKELGWKVPDLEDEEDE